MAVGKNNNNECKLSEVSITQSTFVHLFAPDNLYQPDTDTTIIL